MDSYRVEKQESIRIALPDADSEIDPIPTAGGGHKPEPELDRLSNIIKAFNDQFGNIDWKDGDKIRRVIAEEIPAKVSADKAYQNAMKNSDRQNARIEHDKALQRVIVELLSDHAELFKQFSDNPSFKKWLGDTNFLSTAYRQTQGYSKATRHRSPWLESTVSLAPSSETGASQRTDGPTEAWCELFEYESSLVSRV
jgi:type I restriction enzyme R subunit